MPQLFQLMDGFARLFNNHLNLLGQGCFCLFWTFVILYEIQRRSARISGFAGPAGFPIIGNIAQIRWNASEQYRRWARTYSDVYQIQLGHVPVIVINGAAAAKSLLGQNPQAMGSRPIFPTFHKIVSDTVGTTIGTSPYDESFKRRRKAAALGLNKTSINMYLQHLDIETGALIAEFFESGAGGHQNVDPLSMIQRLSLSLSLTMNWGTPKLKLSSDLFHEIAVVQNQISRLRSTTGNLEDYVPLLRLNPFDRRFKMAESLKFRRDAFLKSLNDDLDDRISLGVHQPCIRASIIFDRDVKLHEAEMSSVSLTMLSAGLNTITAVLRWSIAMLAERTDIQDTALVAIRNHFSSEQPLCDVEDDQTCPYVQALVKECLRYYPPNRLSLPRTSIEDIYYEGKLIPKGTTVFLNSWACNMDATVFGDPEVFRPERWLGDKRLPLFTYGIGYRMCAGFLLANRELYLVFMRLINCYKIRKVGTIDAHPVTGATDPSNLATMPKRYMVRFVPRNRAALERALEDYRI